MNPFDYMARVLPQPDPAPPATQAEGGTKTDRMRDRLRQGRCYGRELAAVAGIEAALVSALLKADLASGRVRRVRDATGRQMYENNPDHDDQAEQQIRAAVALLRRHGWRCTGPGDRRAA